MSGNWVQQRLVGKHGLPNPFFGIVRAKELFLDLKRPRVLGVVRLGPQDVGESVLEFYIEETSLEEFLMSSLSADLSWRKCFGSLPIGGLLPNSRCLRQGRAAVHEAASGRPVVAVAAIDGPAARSGGALPLLFRD